MAMDRRVHWEKIYQTKGLQEVSWYQPVPATSLEFIQEAGLAFTAKIIDVGGGDGFLVDHLLDRGYVDLTVLDISEAAIARAQERLGERASMVKWIVADASSFVPPEKYDLWHDRAAFHFLTEEKDISAYLRTAREHLKPNAGLIIGSFSDRGPKKCSGVEIRQYTEDSLTEIFGDFFERIRCIRTDHPTPFGSTQNFVFCSFRRREAGESAE